MLLFFFVWFSTQIVPFLFLPPIYVIQYLLNAEIVNWEITVTMFKFLTNFYFIQVNEQPLIHKGFILCNHRSWTDFAIDQYYSKSSQTGRLLAYICCPVSLFNYIDGRAIIINRKSPSHITFKKLLNHNTSYSNRISIYPEGTRKNYSNLENIEQLKSYLKYGLLKRIYEHKLKPVQCFISSNKDKVLNEKKLSCRRNICIKNAISKPIHPNDFSKFEDFIHEICREWVNCWKLTHLEFPPVSTS